MGMGSLELGAEKVQERLVATIEVTQVWAWKAGRGHGGGQHSAYVIEL